MPEVIASTYEIKKVLGAGGGGTVFLARHMRLNKDVVLKADKRRITTKEELLRREVNVLKDLHHAHIPQVYDFFVEADTVYTVIDFVQGESLDKPLKRGEKFSQAQVIKWGRQILDALSYLHSPTHGDPPRGYVHSDIKPANLMRTPDGDICLIDFNIALAIGEESIVGLSAGYASPEHYGLDYSSVGGGSAFTAETSGRAEPENSGAKEERTVLIEDGDATDRIGAASDQTQTVALEADDEPPDGDIRVRMGPIRIEKSSAASETGSKRRKVIPDVRSDIYSVGATLYHLLSGTRPAKDAKKVVPLSEKQFSPLVVRIIAKAMDPNPELRYQTAAEMLAALNGLRKNDARVRRLKRQNAVAALFLTALFAAGVCASFIGLKRIQATDSWLKKVEYSKNALAEGDTKQAIELALEAIPQKTDILTPPAPASAQEALTDALGIYELSDQFQEHLVIELPSEPLKMVLSPSGAKVAAIYAYNAVVYDTESGMKLAEMPVEPSVLSDLLFLDDGVLALAGEQGVCVYDLAGEAVLWTGKPATQLAASADGKRVAAVYKDAASADIYDAASGAVLDTVSFDGRSQFVPVNDIFADAERDVLALNKDGTMLAASFSDGSLSIFDLQQDDLCIDLLQAGDYAYFRGGFCGQYFAFSADRAKDSLLAVVDVKNWTQTFGATALSQFILRADESGICVAAENMLVSLDPATGEQTELAHTDETITAFSRGGEYTLVTEGNKSYRIYDRGAGLSAVTQTGNNCDFLALAEPFAVIGSRDSHTLRSIRLQDHADAELLTYDPAFDHDEARLSADGKTVMLFRPDAFRLYDRDGMIVADVEIPDGKQVYDQQFIRDADGSRLEVTYYDGTIRAWSAQNGSLLWERQAEAPDASADEVFYTDRLRIDAPLHETPVAYDLETGREFATLESDDYLIYVTQTGEYIVTEYVTTQGERYGLLLNEQCETLAKLPELCDIVDGKLIFDCPSGHLRTSDIYTLPQLCEMARDALVDTAG